MKGAAGLVFLKRESSSMKGAAGLVRVSNWARLHKE